MVREINRRCQKRAVDNKMKIKKDIEYVDQEIEKKKKKKKSINIKPNEFQDLFDYLQNEA